MPADSLTFIFPDFGLNANALGYHWTMGCGNDVVEGGGTPVPEPTSLLLLGLGLAGFGVYRHKAAREQRLNPMHQRAYINRGLAYERLGNIQQAIENYSVAILPDPDDGKPYYFRGLAFKRLGMVTQATADLKRAADLRYKPASEALLREIRVRHFCLATTAEKEVRPMGSEYGEYSPLDRTGLRDGYKMSVGNARRLISDARALMDAGRYRGAHLILLLVLEELGSAMQLYEAGRSGVQDWEAWWRRFFSHPKDLESASLGIARREEANERFTRVREDLVYVNFDRNNEKFIAPPEDEDSELLEFVEREAAHAEEVLKALPPHAFERWELEEMVQQSPEIVPSVLYARIEELVNQDPTAGERDLLTTIARDLGRSPDDFAAGFERWKKIAPKARVYVDLLRRVQDRMKTQRETEGR